MKGNLYLLFLTLIFFVFSFTSLYGEEATTKNPMKILEESKNHYLMASCPDDSNPNTFRSDDSREVVYIIEKTKDGTIVKESYPPPSVLPMIQAGDSLLNLGKAKEARDSYFEALNVDSLYPRIYSWIGDTYFIENQYDEALRWYQRCLEKNPADFQAYRFKADVYERQGKLEEAMDALVSALIYNIDYYYAWDDLHQIGLKLSYPVTRHTFKQRCWMEPVGDSTYRMCVDSSLAAWPEKFTAWLGFISTKAVWQVEGKFFEEIKNEKEYYLTLSEVYDCFNWLIIIWRELKKENPRLSDGDLDFYDKLAEDGFLQEYVCLEVLSQLNRPLLIKKVAEENLLPRLKEFFFRYYIQKT
jgi:tetratricopeptide (TPR) repeat protein